MQQPTSLITAYIHEDRYTARLSHVSNVKQLLFSRKLLKKITEITLAIKNTIQSIMKKSQRANHAVMKIHMTSTTNNDS